MLFTRVLVALLATLALFGPGLAYADDLTWEAVDAGGPKLALPKGWRKTDGFHPEIVLFYEGDGLGVPIFDETKSPLQIGFTVEKFPKLKKTLKEFMASQVEQAKNLRNLKLVGKELVEELKLADGTEAKLLTAELKGEDRRNLQMMLAAKAADGTLWVASGYVIGGKDSKWPTPESKYAKWVRAHLESLSLDPAKFDADKLKAVYAELKK